MSNRPLCVCGNLCRTNGKSKVDGRQLFKTLCGKCAKDLRIYGTSYGQFKKDTCEVCGFIPITKFQLDVDHIDADKFNNDPSNLQTLCANCHRLKTYENEDYLPK